MHHEIFIDEVYKFPGKSDAPSIIDAGANIGLSVIYFKRLYPKARIVAFEPDPELFSIMKSNVNAFGYGDVILHEKALWSEEMELPFCREGSWAGHLSHDSSNKETILVPTVRLRDLLNEPVDMLKVDIEGAEMAVLSDCADLLKNVANLFVEYHSFRDRPQELHALLGTLAAAGLRYNVQGASTRQPFLPQEEELDNLASIWAYRR